MRDTAPPLFWLYSLASLVILMTLLGGLTRLTGSGLSITEWAPIQGILPPMTTENWHVLFQKYQQTPEYLYVNLGMTMDDFKNIFWLEYIHRLLGRIMGLVFILPLLYLAWQKRIPEHIRLWLVSIALLGALQGVMGWLMVKSGLSRDPWVSPARLGAHLLLAFALYATIIQTAQRWRHNILPRLYYPAAWRLFLPILFMATIFYGALVAGWKAGLIYNTFPLMGDTWIPDEAFSMRPFWDNFYSNPATVQWTHRLLALTFVTSTVVFCISAWINDQLQGWHILLLGVVLLQLSLGILTLLFHVPIFLALAHQGTAFAILTLLMHKEATRQEP